MSYEDDPKHPLWESFDDEHPPETLHAGYYQGLTGRWLMTGTSKIPDTARFILSQLDRPGRLLVYRLEEVVDFPIEERLKMRNKGKAPMRIRKPIRVRMPKGG